MDVNLLSPQNVRLTWDERKLTYFICQRTRRLRHICDPRTAFPQSTMEKYLLNLQNFYYKKKLEPNILMNEKYRQDTYYFRIFAHTNRKYKTCEIYVTLAQWENIFKIPFCLSEFLSSNIR